MNRTFVVIDATIGKRKKIDLVSSGRYKAMTPVGAAKKAVTKLCSLNKKSGVCTVTIHIREIGGRGKDFVYTIQRIRNPVTVTRANTAITFKYTLKAKAIRNHSD
jgi:hypothetical protein